jgi:hypothetical protein
MVMRRASKEQSADDLHEGKVSVASDELDHEGRLLTPEIGCLCNSIDEVDHPEVELLRLDLKPNARRRANFDFDSAKTNHLASRPCLNGDLMTSGEEEEKVWTAIS